MGSVEPQHFTGPSGEGFVVSVPDGDGGMDHHHFTTHDTDGKKMREIKHHVVYDRRARTVAAPSRKAGQ